MSTVTVANIESRSSGATSFSQGLTVGGVDIKTLVAVTEYHTGGTQPSSAANGAIWWDGTNVQQYVNAGWITLSGSFPAPFGDRGLVAGGSNSSVDIRQFTIPTASNATDFGDLTINRQRAGGCSSGSRGLFISGEDSSNQAIQSIDYVTIATAGNAADFGDLLAAIFSPAACASTVRGVAAGGTTSGGQKSDVIQYVTIATTGNATDFGDLTVALNQFYGCSNGSRGVFCGGNDGVGSDYASNVMQYITIDTAGNATDFGDLLSDLRDTSACSNDTRAVIAGGFYDGSHSNVIQYITVASTGNATDFGDLLSANSVMAAVANSTRAVFSGGDNGGATEDMSYVTIATTGNATDFGDMLNYKTSMNGACSGD
tara:strand:- start:11025 stop:12140 length:1116 start_codon:yes stop_codon:yes gene_type:complete